MPDLLGFDARTRASKLANAAIGALAGQALSTIPTSLRALYSSMPSFTGYRARRSRRSLLYRRRRRFGRFRRRYRRRNKLGRGARATFIAGRGAFQRRFRRRIGRKLNTRLTRNDYDSTREIVVKADLFPTSTGAQVVQYNMKVIEMGLAQTKLFFYDDYKLSDIQMVLTPVNLSNGAEKLEVAAGSDPYIYAIPRIHADLWTSTPRLETIKSTPGVMRYHMLRKKPIVINLAPIAQVSEELQRVDGTSLEVEKPFKYVTWMHNPQEGGPFDPTLYLSVGNVVFYLPRLAAGSFQPKWKVEYYATCTLRGNRVLADV